MLLYENNQRQDCVMWLDVKLSHPEADYFPIRASAVMFNSSYSTFVHLESVHPSVQGSH